MRRVERLGHNAPMGHPLSLSPNADFDFEIRNVLGAAFSGAADVGEVLAAVAGVDEQDHEGWFRAWLGLGDRVAAQADDALPVSAAAAHLRAATYYASAVNAVASLADSSELLPTFRKHRAQWDAWVDASGLAIERVSIPYEGTTLPGYFFRATGAVGRAAPAAAAPALVTINGSDGALTSLWANAVSGALKRGYHALVFDGPGQQSMLFEHAMPFRPDWEAVMTPVLDAVLARDDVDGDRVMLYGISQAGYWVPRTLAFEHRFAAAVADPGVVDVSTSWAAGMPKEMLQLLAAGQDEEFDGFMAEGLKAEPDVAATWTFRARPYGTTSYADTVRAVQQYAISAEQTAAIRTPLLITSPEKEQFWPGQSEQLAAMTKDVSTLLPFTAAQGADYHCEPLARALVEQRMFDWLAVRIGE